MSQREVGDPDVRTEPVKEGEYVEMMESAYWKEQYDLALWQADKYKRERDAYKEELERLLTHIAASGQTAI